MAHVPHLHSNLLVSNALQRAMEMSLQQGNFGTEPKKVYSQEGDCLCWRKLAVRGHAVRYCLDQVISTDADLAVAICVAVQRMPTLHTGA